MQWDSKIFMGESSKVSSHNLETYSLLWLDATVNSKDNVNIQHKLQSVIKHLQIFEEISECEKYIQSVSNDARLVLIISEHFSQQLIPKIHELKQIYSIYIHCLNKQFYQQWSKQYLKIKGIHDQINILTSTIEGNQMTRMSGVIDEPLSMSIYHTNGNSEKTTSGLNGQFVHSQLLIDCLLRMESIPTDRDEFISLCVTECQNKKQDLEIIKEFRETYSSDKSIWWYTRETFLYRLLNKSLRIQNIDLLFGFRFLIRDIEEKLQKYRCSSRVQLYRGQLISSEELEILQRSKGQLISMNSFFSTTVNRDIALFYLDPSSANNDNNNLRRVLFEIDANPCQKGTKPFANIKSLSYFPEEEEVLMMLGSVFRLDHIYLHQHHIWVLQMTLCSDDDHDLKAIFHHMKNQYGLKQMSLLLFGHVLVDMSHFNEAEKYYHCLLKKLPPDDPDLPSCYHALGKVACENGDYEKSLQWLYQSLEIVERKLRKNHPRIGFIYTGIGEVYQRKGENDQALKSYEKALEIWTEAYHIEHEYIAYCFNNIAIIYDAQEKYQEALDYNLKALKIKKKIFPIKHPCMGNSYLNIGNVYYHLHRYDQALENYQLSYEIYEASLTPKHPSVACAIKNIGIIREIQGKYFEALKNYQKASIIRQSTFQSSHPDSVQIEKDIERVLFKI